MIVGVDDSASLEKCYLAAHVSNEKLFTRPIFDVLDTEGRITENAKINLEYLSLYVEKFALTENGTNDPKELGNEINQLLSILGIEDAYDTRIAICNLGLGSQKLEEFNKEILSTFPNSLINIGKSSNKKGWAYRLISAAGWIGYGARRTLDEINGIELFDGKELYKWAKKINIIS